MVAAVAPDLDTPRLFGERFACGDTAFRPPVQPNLRQSLRQNKTASLITPKGADAGGH